MTDLPCKRCKHRRIGWPFFWVRDFDRCVRPNIEHNGMIEGLPFYCVVERGDYEVIDVCGPSAKYWEPRT